MLSAGFSEDSLYKSFLSFHRVAPRDGTGSSSLAPSTALLIALSHWPKSWFLKDRSQCDI